MQSTSKILMVRPVNFGFNEQTSQNNAFQVEGFQEGAAQGAIEEFDIFVDMLREEGVEVVVIEDTPQPHTPDSIFPNNWFSTHKGGTLVLYPMFAPNRREERKPAPLEYLKTLKGLKRVVDLTNFEEKNRFLEGTGSMVLDRESKLAFACRSSRTEQEVLEEFCAELGYSYFLFNSFDQEGTPVYHTNVMMSVCTHFVIATLDSITDMGERADFIALAEERDREVIEISLEQMAEFAGNMIELKGKDGTLFLVMSLRARESLSPQQIGKMERYCKIISPNLTLIENNGGGSARCMIAELFY